MEGRNCLWGGRLAVQLSNYNKRFYDYLLIKIILHCIEMNSIRFCYAGFLFWIFFHFYSLFFFLRLSSYFFCFCLDSYLEPTIGRDRYWTRGTMPTIISSYRGASCLSLLRLSQASTPKFEAPLKINLWVHIFSRNLHSSNLVNPRSYQTRN